MSKNLNKVMKEKGVQFRPIVYVCAPFRGDIERNVEKAKGYAKHVYEKGGIPLTPHLLFPFMDDRDKKQREDAILMDKILLGKCQEVWVFGENITSGMKEELDIATRRRQKVRYIGGSNEV